MGRPLNKKYFGNFNIGTNGYTPVVGGNIGGDDGIGGEGLAEYTLAAEHGDVLINSSYPAPVLVIPAPTLPGGVQATAQVVWEVDRIALTTTSTNYTDTLPTNVTFTGLGGGVIGRMTATNGPDHAATTAGINFNNAGANRGEFIDTPPRANATYEVCTGVNISGGGDNAQCQVFFRIKRITTVQKGSGYVAAPTITWNTAGGSGSPFPGAPTVALTTDSGARDGGNLNVATNQDNAIIIYANVGGEGGVLIGDIIEQVGSRRYRVKTADGIAVCKLVDYSDPGANEAYIKATDDNSNTYFVTKLTAHRATLVQWNNSESTWLYANNAVAGWSFTSTMAPGYIGADVLENGLVIIENA